MPDQTPGTPQPELPTSSFPTQPPHPSDLYKNISLIRVQKPVMKVILIVTLIILVVVGGYVAYTNIFLNRNKDTIDKNLPPKVRACLKKQIKPCLPPNACMANPASVFCECMGGTMRIIKNEVGGSESGGCTIDGQEQDEWDYYRKMTTPPIEPL